MYFRWVKITQSSEPLVLMLGIAINKGDTRVSMEVFVTVSKLVEVTYLRDDINLLIYWL